MNHLEISYPMVLNHALSEYNVFFIHHAPFFKYSGQYEKNGENSDFDSVFLIFH